MLTTFLLCQSTLNFAAEPSDPADPNRYLNAVRTFAGNVLKYGRDTYGPKHTPLFVDGLMVRDPNDPNYGKDAVFKPVEWIDPDGTKWILSNLASQHNLFRTQQTMEVTEISYARIPWRHSSSLSLRCLGKFFSDRGMFRSASRP